MERQKFEESLKKTFDQAEFTPSDKVWTNIELDLERLERGDMKKRLTFFKLLAAASVIFALGVAGTGIYMLIADRSGKTELTARQDQAQDGLREVRPHDNASLQENEGSKIVPQNQPAGENNTASGETGIRPASPDDREAFAPSPTTDSPSLRNEEVAVEKPDTGMTTLAANAEKESVQEKQRPVIFKERPLPALVMERKIVPHFPKTEPDQIDLLLASIEMEEKASREKDKFEGEKIWTSVGFSAGTFNNYNQGGAAPVNSPMGAGFNLSSVNTTLANETEASGVSYSIGVNVGGKVAPRWVLQGGFNYMTQNAAFTSDAVVTDGNQNFKAAYSAEVTKMSDASARVVPTAPYSVSNNMEYLSIPLQAGYILVNRSFAIQLNGGISTDLFIQNTLQPQSGNLDKVTNGRGSDSPYRPLNFSGLVGTEISYRFAERYRISLNPGIRYPFSSIYKSEVGLTATPVTFDVGLRFKYIFE